MLFSGRGPGSTNDALLVDEKVVDGLHILVTDLVITKAHFALHAHYHVPEAKAIGKSWRL